MPGKQEHVRLSRNGLTVDCFFAESGKLIRKTEARRGGGATHDYTFDPAGHLLEAKRNGVVEESYVYNQTGQRMEQNRAPCRFSNRANGPLRYDGAGLLTRAGDTGYSYDARGALAERSDMTGTTRFTYGNDTRLDEVIFSSGDKIRYEYTDGVLGPVRRFMRGNLVWELAWAKPLLLGACRDYEQGLDFAFGYDQTGVLAVVRITPLPEALLAAQKRSPDTDPWRELATEKRREKLRAFIRNGVTYQCGCDQVGTPKIFTLFGEVMKELTWDSFGNPRGDTRPELFLPIGFAGGLADRDTGLVRFGWRDYDPAVGRFTAPDPLGDTGGDHDLYDYCVDDPVSLNDRTGLIPLPLLLLGGKALAFGIGAVGSLIAAKLADTSAQVLGGQETTAATDGVWQTLPKVAAASAFSALPGALVTGAPVAASAIGGAADLMAKAYVAKDALIATSPVLGGLAPAAKMAKEFVGGYAFPFTGNYPSNLPGMAGAATAEILRHPQTVKDSIASAIETLHQPSQTWEPYVGRGMR